jgi:hypothetical protein
MSKICSNCGSLNSDTTKEDGSTLITIILLICYIIPGIIYFLWRGSTKRIICKNCKNSTIIDAKTPLGKEMYAKYHKKN